MVLNKNKRIISSIVFSVLLLSAFFYFINKDNFSKTSVVDTGSNNQAAIRAKSFPTAKNDLDVYNFRCEVTEVLYPNHQTIDGKTIRIGVGCNYLDTNKKLQEVKIPLLVENLEAGNRISEVRYSERELPLWDDEDFMREIEVFHYYANGVNTNLYQDPEKTDYWEIDNKKPILSPGDEVVVYIAPENSRVFSDKNLEELYKNTAEFFKDYHQNIYTYDKIIEFNESGDPKILNNEPDGWIIPSWANFAKDNDPQ